MLVQDDVLIGHQREVGAWQFGSGCHRDSRTGVPVGGLGFISLFEEMLRVRSTAAASATPICCLAVVKVGGLRFVSLFEEMFRV